MNREIKMAESGKSLGGDQVFFIAEIGKGFIQSEDERSVEEYLDNAKALVKAAKEAGADAVKFQTHVREDEVLDLDFTSPHFKGSDRYSWVGRNESATPLDEFWKPLKAYCDEQGILFFSTPMSRKAAILLNEEIGVSLWKVGSGDVQDYVTLNYLISTGKPIIISTGMVSLTELDDVVKYVLSKEAPLVVLYCVSKYPCPLEDFNLATIERFIEQYPKVVVGFSDHSITHEAVKGALKLGAKVIEKHLTFDRDLWGSDHKAALLPDEFKKMVEIAKSGQYQDVDVSKYYGDQDKELEGATNQYRPYFNKALMAGTDIPVGTVVTEEMVYAMRPVMHAGGLPANQIDKVVGKKTARDLKKFDPLNGETLS